LCGVIRACPEEEDHRAWVVLERRTCAVTVKWRRA
jgi:hypothetical protein